jgi:thiamine kinase-like enzyme
MLDRFAEAPILPQATLQELLDGPRGAPLPAPIRDANRLHDGLRRLSARVRARPNCLVHGDAHAGNLYRADTKIAIVDWQVLQQGSWAQDVAYHIAAVLKPEDRRAHEQALLHSYLDQLAALGGPRLVFDEVWDDYRAAMIYGYYLWGVTRRVDPDVTNEFVRRLGLAVSELDAFAVVAGQV